MGVFMAVRHPPAALALAALLAGASPTSAHIIIFKTCLGETIEAVSTPMLEFSRRPFARRSAVYSWNALAADKFGGRYADFTLSEETRALCEPMAGGGYACVLTGIPCREVDDCAKVVNHPCYEVER